MYFEFIFIYIKDKQCNIAKIVKFEFLLMDALYN